MRSSQTWTDIEVMNSVQSATSHQIGWVIPSGTNRLIQMQCLHAKKLIAIRNRLCHPFPTQEGTAMLVRTFDVDLMYARCCCGCCWSKAMRGTAEKYNLGSNFPTTWPGTCPHSFGIIHPYSSEMWSRRCEPQKTALPTGGGPLPFLCWWGYGASQRKSAGNTSNQYCASGARARENMLLEI